MNKLLFLLAAMLVATPTFAAQKKKFKTAQMLNAYTRIANDFKKSQILIGRTNDGILCSLEINKAPRNYQFGNIELPQVISFQIQTVHKNCTEAELRKGLCSGGPVFYLSHNIDELNYSRTSRSTVINSLDIVYDEGTMVHWRGDLHINPDVQGRPASASLRDLRTESGEITVNRRLTCNFL